MPTISLAGAGVIGVNKDLPYHYLPPEAWTEAKNVDFYDGVARRSLGWDSTFGTPGAAPSFLLPFDNADSPWWLYASAVGSGSKVYAYDGNTHTDISKSGDYDVDDGEDWNGTVFQGVPVINPVSDDPQYWSEASAGTDLDDLPNWPSDFRCRVIRSYKNFLIALRTIESDSELPYRLRWSDAAVPGSVPGSWDVTDATTDAGEVDINDAQGGRIQEGGELGEVFAVYTKEGTHILRFVGGSFVMANEVVSRASGIMSARMMANASLQGGEFHIIWNGTDLVTFDGNEIKSVVNRSLRRFLVNDIDSSNFQKGYAFVDDVRKLFYLVYPESGSDSVTKALVWNFRDNTFSFREWNANHAAYGSVAAGGGDLWSGASEDWGDYVGGWQGDVQRNQVILANSADDSFYRFYSGDTLGGSNIDAYVERTGLAVIGQKRDGEPIVDIESRKLAKRIWPRVRGGKVNVRIGAQERIDGSIDWQSPQTFDPDVDQYLDFTANGRLIAVRFESQTQERWILDGYDIEIEKLGAH